MPDDAESAAEPVLVVAGLTVDFPGIRAVDRVDLALRRGEVHALVGENGAGKSTLLKVLAGVERPTSGTIRLRGADYRPANTAAAIDSGVSVIHQEFTLFPHLSVSANVFIGREPHHILSRGLDERAMRLACAEVFGRLGLDIDPSAAVAELPVSQQQLVEIARALVHDGDVIVMDEPTAALTTTEIERLLGIVGQLRAADKAVVFVSHHLEEVFEVADRITVLRDGRVVGDLDATETGADEVIRLMVGRDLESIAPALPTRPDLALFAMTDVDGGPLSGVTLDVGAGEVVGIGGIAGAGQVELGRVVFGDLAPTGGRMTLAAAAYAPRSPRQAMSRGVGFLHEDRKAAGIFPDLSVVANATITLLDLLRTPARLLSERRERAAYARFADRLRIRTVDPGGSIVALSGGNQQKVLLARALSRGTRLLVLNEPTRGVDIGGKLEIHRLIREAADQGAAVLLVTGDLPELLALSNRIVVLARGRVVGRLAGAERTEENVVACAAGGRRIGLAP